MGPVGFRPISRVSGRTPYFWDTGNVALGANTSVAFSSISAASAFLINGAVPGADVWLHYLSHVVQITTALGSNGLGVQAAAAFLAGLNSVHKRGISGVASGGFTSFFVGAQASPMTLLAIDCDLWVSMDEFLASTGGLAFGGPYSETQVQVSNTTAGATTIRMTIYGLYEFWRGEEGTRIPTTN